MRTTLKDLSKHTGLAMSTISMALNDHPRIKSETRRMVQATAAELNYHPHPAARALVRRRTALIGLIIQDAMSSFYPEIVQGAEDVANEKSLGIILCSTNEQTDREVDCLTRLLDKQVDGIIMVPHQSQQDRILIEEILRQGIPLVTILRRYPGLNIPFIMVDNESGGYLATRYLLDKGHRKIGHVQGPVGDDTAEPRIRGYWRALWEAGIEPEPYWTCSGRYDHVEGRRAMGQLLDQFPEMTAVFAASDLTALGAINELSARGYSIPDQMAVVGYDGVFYGQILEPTLTTVSQPRYQIGQLAAEMLFKRMENVPVHSLTLQPQILIGSSA